MFFTFTYQVTDYNKIHSTKLTKKISLESQITIKYIQQQEEKSPPVISKSIFSVKLKDSWCVIIVWSIHTSTQHTLYILCAKDKMCGCLQRDLHILSLSEKHHSQVTEHNRCQVQLLRSLSNPGKEICLKFWRTSASQCAGLRLLNIWKCYWIMEQYF